MRMPGEREREGKPPVESPGGAVPRSLDRGCSAAAPGGCWAGGGDRAHFPLACWVVANADFNSFL